MASYTQSGISVSREGALQIIRFDNERKRNAIQLDGYRVVSEALAVAAKDSGIRVTALTGTGSHYSSGFDMTEQSDQTGDQEDIVKESVACIRRFIDALIDHPKLLIAVVNGPATGVAVTTLGLCDAVLCVPEASFRTPFSQRGLCAEGCSSWLFPRGLGPGFAARLLLLGETLTSEEALRCGLVSHVVPSLPKAWEMVRNWARELPPESTQATKALMRSLLKENLHKINHLETEELVKRLTSEEFMSSLMEFMTRKQTSKY